MPAVIQVQNLSKRYRIGLKEQRADTFAGQLLNVLRSPIDNFRRLRSLNRFGEEDESVFWALRDINFEVQEGEVLGIIGHNGAGKSTLLKILSRITEPTSGEVRLRGRVSALLEVGTGFHPELTGRENVYMNGTILGMTRKEIDLKFDEIVDFSGVEKYIDTPVKFYSSGMTVRLGFAVAAHLEPEILIIDEVLAVGDAEFQKKCLGKMEDVATQGRTVLFVSHNMVAVQNLCKRSTLLKKGEIVFDGETKQTIEKYLSGKKGASVYLLDSTDRRGNGAIKIERVDISGAIDDPHAPVLPGKEMFLKVFLKTELPAPLRPRVDLRIDSFLGQRLVWLSNSIYGEKEMPRNSVVFRIPQCPLSEGEYSVTLYVNYQGDTCDWIQNAVSFSVAGADFFGTGKITPHIQSNILIPFDVLS